MAKKTHHKHSSTKGYRKLLDSLAELDGVHRVATGKVKPRMGSGRPVAPISKVRKVESGLSITINTDGAIIDAYVITDRPDEVAAAMGERGWISSEDPGVTARPASSARRSASTGSSPYASARYAAQTAAGRS